MAATNTNIFIPRANFMPGANAVIVNAPGFVGANPSEAVMGGTRGAFVIDASVNPPSSFIFKTPSPWRTVGRRVDIISDADWGFSHFPETLFANLFPIFANQVLTIELFAEPFTLYVASASGNANFRMWCKA